MNTTQTQMGDGLTSKQVIQILLEIIGEMNFHERVTGQTKNRLKTLLEQLENMKVQFIEDEK